MKRNYLWIPPRKSQRRTQSLKRQGRPRRNHGFTLLELLVVIGIIGVLVSIASVSYSAAQKRSRDARRKTDIRSLQSALEQYYTDNSFQYPTAGCCVNAAEDYLNGSCPIDPIQTGQYFYDKRCGNPGTSYYLCATMEVPGTGNSDSEATNSLGAGHSWGGSNNYFCVKSVQ